MNEQQVIDRFSSQDGAFTIEGPVSVTDLIHFLKGLEQKVFAFNDEEPSWLPLSSFLPDDLPIGHKIGLDYLEFSPETDEEPHHLYFIISWENPGWELFEGFFSIDGFDLQFYNIGRSVTVIIDGFATIDNFQLSLSLELPSFMVKAQLANYFEETLPSPKNLLERFGSLPTAPGNTTDGLRLRDLSLLANPRGRTFFLNLELDNLQIGPVTVAAQLQLNYADGDIGGKMWSTFEFEAGGNSNSNKPPNHYVIGLTAEHPGPDEGWQLEGGLFIEDGLELGELFDCFVGLFKINKPNLGFETGLALKYIYLSVNTRTQQYIFTVDFTLDKPMEAEIRLSIDLTKRDNGSSYDKVISGELTLGSSENERIFDLIFSDINNGGSANTKKQLLALYRKPGGEKIPLSVLLSKIASNLPLQALEFRIMNALLVIIQESEDDNTRKFLFTTEMDFGIDLSGLTKLPILSDALPHDEALKINFQPIISPDDPPKRLTEDDLKDIKKIMPVGGPSLPEKLSGGLALVTTIQLGSFKKSISLGVPDEVNNDLGDTDVQEAGDTGNSASPIATDNAAAPAPSQVVADKDLKWIEVGKNYGPLHFSRIGVGYKDGQIDALLEADLSVGPIKIALEGLAAHYVIPDKKLHFSLEGLGLDMREGPLEITGAFMRLGDEFVGKVLVKAEDFSISALGAYGQYEGNPSLFIYAFLDYPLGGPAFFFVEGLAFGFGFNRRLIIPPISEIYKFPLVAEAIGDALPAPGINRNDENLADTLRAEFGALSQYIPAETGQYFLAIGLKFNSFKTLDGFALLVVNFGRQFNLGIIGVTRLSVPNITKDEKIPKVAIVEMAFSVQFIPDEGFLGVDARLTPNSYIYASLCKLQGGFAFYTWFSGPHEGDFVVTLGGYHPKYVPEKHYPQPADVPRLSFNWRLSDHLFFKGEAYYAMTPKAMMMGARLEGHLDLNTKRMSVNAWFVAKVDFLIYWEPFFYEATASVEIGCEIVIHAWFCNVTVNLNAGAELQVWGPEFTGIAHIHAKVFSKKINFDLSFGATKPGLPPRISWAEFETAFLPPSRTDWMSVTAKKGLQATVQEGDSERWVINAKELMLGVSTVIPLTKAAGIISTGNTIVDIPGHPPAKGVCVDPAGLDKTNFITASTFRIFRDDDPDNNIALEKFDFIPINKSFPKALWTDELSTGAHPDPNGDQMLDCLGGYLIVPKDPPKQTATQVFAVKDLSVDQSVRELTTEDAIAPKYTMDNTPLSVAARNETRKIALEALGFVVEDEVNIDDQLEEAFWGTPLSVNIL